MFIFKPAFVVTAVVLLLLAVTPEGSAVNIGLQLMFGFPLLLLWAAAGFGTFLCGLEFIRRCFVLPFMIIISNKWS